MFFHNLKYMGLSVLRIKVSIFWTLIFPIALATFMYAAFGRLYEKDEIFKDIPVAVVREDGDEALMEVLESLDSEEEDSLLDVKILNENDAKYALDEKEVTGIIYTKDVSLIVNESSNKASILESILKQYKQKNYVIQDIAKSHPEKLADIVDEMKKEVSYFKESSTSNGVQNEYYNYFYAIFAMSCLFASFSSVGSTCNLQAYSSSIGMRKNLAPHSKIKFIVSEYIVLLAIHFVVELIALGYMVLLGIDFGERILAIILTLFLGCMIGLSMGVIIGAIPKLTVASKIGISISIGMALSVLADLCIAGIKNLVEHNLPILNKLNPAVLISDCFYSLNVYDNYDRFFENITILGIESVLLIVVGFLMIRREKYASI